MNKSERSNARDAIRKMYGTEVHWACVRLIYCYKILIKNSLELIGFSSNPPRIQFVLLPDVKSRIQKNDLDSQAIRLIHNYLASVKTLVDNSRRVSEKYLNSELKEQYQSKVKMKIIGDPCAQIIHKLRNYMLHVDMPVIENQIDSSTGFTTALKLIPQKLLMWDKWNIAEKDYLTNLIKKNEKIVIHEFFAAYTEKSECITCY